MGISERKERERLQRREQILDAAHTVFQRYGWSESTMEQVAEAAELSKGTLYLYFSDKEELYTGLGARGLERIADRFREISATVSPAIKALMQIGETYTRHYLDDPIYYTSLHFSTHKLLLKKDVEHPELARMHESGLKCLEAVAEVVKTGIAEGTFRQDVNPMQAAVALWSYSDGFFNHIICQREKQSHALEMGLDMEETLWVGYRWLISGLGADPALIDEMGKMRSH